MKSRRRAFERDRPNVLERRARLGTQATKRPLRFAPPDGKRRWVRARVHFPRRAIAARDAASRSRNARKARSRRGSPSRRARGALAPRVRARVPFRTRRACPSSQGRDLFSVDLFSPPSTLRVPTARTPAASRTLTSPAPPPRRLPRWPTKARSPPSCAITAPAWSRCAPDLPRPAKGAKVALFSHQPGSNGSLRPPARPRRDASPRSRRERGPRRAATREETRARIRPQLPLLRAARAPRHPRRRAATKIIRRARAPHARGPVVKRTLAADIFFPPRRARPPTPLLNAPLPPAPHPPSLTPRLVSPATTPPARCSPPWSAAPGTRA